MKKKLKMRTKKKVRLAVSNMTNHERVIAGRARKLGMSISEYKLFYNADTTKNHTYKSIKWHEPIAKAFFDKLRNFSSTILEDYTKVQQGV